jgi:glucose/mannose-6-phosphate isomerase
MIDLDDPAAYSLDVAGMYGHISGTPAELVRCWDACEGMSLPQGANRARSVVIAGMGGSATAGDYFVQLCTATAALPAMVIRGPEVPNFVGPETLVIVMSHSGNTQETIAAYDDASRRNATLMVITTGGELERRARAHGVALHQFSSDAPPRTAMPQGLAPLLHLGRRTGMVQDGRSALEAAAMAYRAIVECSAPDVPTANNRAKQIAAAIHGRVPLVIGALHLSSTATRFKNQLAENGKMIATADTFPEIGHNLVVGLATAHEVSKRLALVTIEPSSGWPAQRQKLDELVAMFMEAEVPVSRIAINESSLLAELLVATAWGDLVSYYAGIANGQDPTPIREIERLRKA